MADIEDEWSCLSIAYDEVFLPRLVPLYECIGKLVLHHVQSNKEEGKYQLLDYGTGEMKIFKQYRLHCV